MFSCWCIRVIKWFLCRNCLICGVEINMFFVVFNCWINVLIWFWFMSGMLIQVWSLCCCWLSFFNSLVWILLCLKIFSNLLILWKKCSVLVWLMMGKLMVSCWIKNLMCSYVCIFLFSGCLKRIWVCIMVFFVR